MNYDNSEVHRMVESCYRTSKDAGKSYFGMDDEYLWWYIQKEQIEINPLYRRDFNESGVLAALWQARSAGVSLAAIPNIRTPISVHLLRCWNTGKSAATRRSQAGKRRRVSFSGGWRISVWKDR